MAVKRRKVSNLMALALLAILAPGDEMHPYQMAHVLRRTGKEHDLNIRWGSLYTVVQNLEKHGFLEARGSARDGRRPERTLYAITDAGRAELKDWLSELVAVPMPEYPRFQAALSVLGVLHPDEAVSLLDRRLRALDEEIEHGLALLARDGAQVPRMFLIEQEYALTMRQAEAAWIRQLHAELAAGTFPDLADWRAYHETGSRSHAWTHMLAEGGTPADEHQD